MSPPRDLRQFISILKDRGELVEVNTQVDANLELPEIHRRAIADEGKALLFNNPTQGSTRSSFPVLTNIFGTKERVDLAFGDTVHGLIASLVEKLPEFMPPSPAALYRNRDLLVPLLKLGTRKNKGHNPIAEISMSSPDLEQLPFTTSWPEDGGPFLTLPLVYSEDPITGIPNLGMYRIQRYNANTTGLHTQIAKGCGYHIHTAQKLGKHLPVTIFLGGPPALIAAAIAPLPENVPELLLASLLLGSKLETCSSDKTPYPLFSHCEFAICGTVNPAERRPEGPFGDHYGYYSLTHDFPVFHCNHIYHRKDAIFPATVVGKPRQEDFYLGDFLQTALSPLFPIVMPSVVDLWSYGETGFHSLTAAVIKERYQKEALTACLRILGEGQLALTKVLFALDKPMDLRDFRKVLAHLLERVDFASDIFVLNHTAMDTLDYTGPLLNKGSKLILLGTGDKLRDLPQAVPAETVPGSSGQGLFCPGCLVVEGPSYKSHPEYADEVAQSRVLNNWDSLVIVVDSAEETLASEQDFLWSVFTRFEPAQDLYSKTQQILNNHIERTAPVIIDARMKPSYPGVVEVDEVTKQKVDERWEEYFA